MYNNSEPVLLMFIDKGFLQPIGGQSSNPARQLSLLKLLNAFVVFSLKNKRNAYVVCSYKSLWYVSSTGMHMHLTGKSLRMVD